MGINCPECQHENPEDTFFCGKCGTRFPSPGGVSFTHTKTLQTPASELLDGSLVAGRYQLIQELGRGGMGVVYKAHDTKLKRTIALKFLPPQLTHIPEIKERFIREAQAAAALDHPNICTVYEFDEAEDRTFISMAYVEGQSLNKKIASGPLELDEALIIAEQIAEGLREAHKKGIVHRDIKSANIMVTDKSLTKIMDFGLARIEGTTLFTKEGTTMGTVAYMSPEQARGESVDHRTDIWSFGVVLYEMFSGQLPFKGEQDQAVVHSILNDSPVPITDLRTEIPMDLEQVVFKALEKDPDERYQKMDDLLEDLRSISDGIVPKEIRARVRKAKFLKRRRAILVAAISGLIVIMTVIALSLFTGRVASIDSLAVLPLENLTGDAGQEYFVDAATDELIGQLAQIGALRVISRRSVMRYKGLQKPLPEIARELDVDAVVEGTVLQVGDSVRLRVQLIEALPEERNLWAQTYERDMTDVLVMYKDMARAIAEEARVKLTSQEKEAFAITRQVNPEAYEAYNKGMFQVYQLTEQGLEKALGYFELALEKDPNYALAYVGIASVWGGRLQQGLVSFEEGGPKARSARQKALELDDTLAQVHYTLATQNTWIEWDWGAAEKAFRKALELNPRYADARAYYSYFLFYMDRPDEAMEQIEQALELDPFHAVFRSIYARDLMYAHRFDEAVDHLQETFRTAPQDQMTLSALKSAYHLKGMHEEALDIWRTWFAVKGDGEAEDALARGYAEAGYSGALTSVAEMMIERSRTAYVTPWQIATLFTRAGKKDEAIEWLEKAYEAHDSNMPYISVDPIFDDLRSDPRFQDLLRRMNFPERE
jgi:TolB-like protein/Tfp pilus assembly protein PilF/predicted Ser/Thr protein kinase